MPHKPTEFDIDAGQAAVTFMGGRGHAKLVQKVKERQQQAVESIFDADPERLTIENVRRRVIEYQTARITLDLVAEIKDEGREQE